MGQQQKLPIFRNHSTSTTSEIFSVAGGRVGPLMAAELIGRLQQPRKNEQDPTAMLANDERGIRVDGSLLSFS